MGLLKDWPFAQRTLWGVLEPKSTSAQQTDIILEVAGEQATLEQLRRGAREVASKLASVGVEPGDVVAHMGTNSLAYVHTIFAVACLGALECPINAQLRGAPLSHVLSHSKARTLIVDHDLLEVVRDVLPHSIKRIVVRGSSEPELSRPEIAMEAIDGVPISCKGQSPSDIATIMYTSGTTGPAKGVMLPHHFSFSTAAIKADTWGLSEDDVLYSPLPLFHSNARYSSLLTGLIVGARVVISKRFSATRFWQDVTEQSASEVGVVGTIPGILLNRPPGPYDTSHRVRMIHGGGALSLSQRAQFEERFNVRLVVGFAMTETGHIATTSPSDDGRYRGAGRPAEPFEVSIVDEFDRPVAANTVGEIVVRSREPYAMFSGYFRDDSATVTAFRNLLFHTGDLGTIDLDGYLHWIDRKKDVIRKKGEMVAPRDIESAALKYPGIEEAAAVGVPSPLGEEDIVLFVVTHTDRGVELEALLSYLGDSLPVFSVPDQVVSVDSFPRTATSKVDKVSLRSIYVETSQ